MARFLSLSGWAAVFWLSVCSSVTVSAAGAFCLRASGRLLEAQHSVPFHSGSGVLPVFLEKLGHFFLWITVIPICCTLTALFHLLTAAAAS